MLSERDQHAKAVPESSQQAGDQQQDGRPVLLIGYLDFPPFYYVDEQGNPAGTMYQVAERVAAQAGYRIEAILLPNRRFIAMIANGEVDFAIGLRTIPAFKDRVLSSEVAVGSMTVCVYSSYSLQDFEFPDSAAGKRVAVVRGYTYGDLKQRLQMLTPSAYLLEVADHQAGLQTLYGRKMDYFLGYKEAIEGLHSGLPLPESRVLQTVSLHLLVPMARPGAQELLRVLEQALETIEGNPAL